MKRENVRTNRNSKNKKVEKRAINTPKESSELIRVKKKYNFKYIMLSNLFEFHLIFLLVFICFIARKDLLSLLMIICMYILVIIVLLVLYKKSASGTYMSFQEDKVVYRRKFLLRDTREEMPYKDIKEIVFGYDLGTINKFWQKRMNIGNITIYPKKGNVLIHGMEITNVGPFDKIMVDLKNNIGDKIV